MSEEVVIDSFGKHVDSEPEKRTIPSYNRLHPNTSTTLHSDLKIIITRDRYSVLPVRSKSSLDRLPASTINFADFFKYHRLDVAGSCV